MGNTKYDREFIELVRKMRQAQKNYFESRSLDALTLSKNLESEVDNYIENVDQLNLFE